MIRHVTHVYTDLESLTSEITSGATSSAAISSQSQLVQIYCADANDIEIRAIVSAIVSIFPEAAVVGASTVGEVANGRLVTGHTVIGFTFFESSRINVVAMASLGGDEREVGAEVGRRVKQYAPDIAGVLLLSTPLSHDASTLLQGIQSTLGDYPVFGGGAGSYAAMRSVPNSFVFSKYKLFNNGVVAVAFCGNNLYIESRTYLGWQPLSRSMKVTEVDGLNIRRVDDQPASDIYHRYLNISADDQFFLNALEFPLLLEREGTLLARVPVSMGKDGALQFVADIREGESFRIGYGNVELIAENSENLHRSMAQFSPQAIFLYTCGCRRFLMQEDVELETLPLESVAPTFGFYTYGEFFGSSSLMLLNSTMVAVGLREGFGQKTKSVKKKDRLTTLSGKRDPYANKHARILSRLMYFINAVTSELESSIEEVAKLSVTDQLTQLANRTRLNQVLNEQINLAKRYATPFSVILLDVDYFKRVNDTHGHLVGDDVLVRVAHTLSVNARNVDTIGRWGGEEFMIVAPNTSIGNAVLLAEKLRSSLEGTEFPVVGITTASFGVAEYHAGDDLEKLVARADVALYKAKKAGRNRVEYARFP